MQPLPIQEGGAVLSSYGIQYKSRSNALWHREICYATVTSFIDNSFYKVRFSSHAVRVRVMVLSYVQ